VKGDPKLAVMRYLAMPFEGEGKSALEARIALWESGDVEEALRSFPGHLSFEIAILNHLASHRDDYAGSFDVLSKNLRRMFVHAYQSFLFNKILSRRVARGLPLTPVEGDLVIFPKAGRPNGAPDASKVEKTTPGNIRALERLAVRGRAFVALPLFGSDSTFSDGVPGEIEREVIEEAGVVTSDFIIPQNPALGSAGTRRSAIVRTVPSCRVDAESAEIEFFLPAGSYATVILREFMKADSPYPALVRRSTMA
jgi:tRNA pseudouridine13 synthase